MAVTLNGMSDQSGRGGEAAKGETIRKAGSEGAKAALTLTAAIGLALLVRPVMTHGTPGSRTHLAMTGHVACDSADDSAFDAALRLCRTAANEEAACEQGGKGGGNGLHVGLLSGL